MTNIPIHEIKQYFQRFQDEVYALLQAYEPARPFTTDSWEYTGGGGGESRVLEDGAIIERAGVNVSHVLGDELPTSATQKRPHLAQSPFQALGVSLVIHPRNPYAPTTHANLRCFYVTPHNQPPTWWFGGGFDLTPYYGFEEDCKLWHQHARDACSALTPNPYPKFKQWCDDYFYLPHRQEPRGIGGIFFDDLNEWSFDECFQFVQGVGAHFIEAYQAILQKRQSMQYSDRERAFQCYRRSRYVEFNLLYDRGTLFGLQSGGRTESILVSMPPQVTWRYNWRPQPNTPEHALYQTFLKPRDWI